MHNRVQNDVILGSGNQEERERENQKTASDPSPSRSTSERHLRRIPKHRESQNQNKATPKNC